VVKMAIYFGDLDKALVFAALYNGAKPSGKDIREYDPEPMTCTEAKKLVLTRKRFDYVKGRILLIIFVGDTFNQKLYNKNNGEGAAEIIIESLRLTGDVNNSEIVKIHKKNTKMEIKRMVEKY
jgi:hypothetical protein